jgi:hypothetical protein
MVARRQNRAGGAETCARKGEGSGLLIAVDDDLACTKSTMVTAWTPAWARGVRCVRRRTVGWAAAMVGTSRFARPVDVHRLATGNWVWTSVRGRGTSGRNDAPTFVPGWSAAWADAARHVRRHALVRTGAVQICLATFDQVFSNFCNRSDPRWLYKSCRALNPLQLLERLYRVFLNQFCRKGMPTWQISGH